MDRNTCGDFRVIGPMVPQWSLRHIWLRVLHSSARSESTSQPARAHSSAAVHREARRRARPDRRGAGKGAREPPLDFSTRCSFPLRPVPLHLELFSSWINSVPPLTALSPGVDYSSPRAGVSHTFLKREVQRGGAARRCHGPWPLTATECQEAPY
ncbi:hypothetical protein NFI96_010415 [Prochilodus magdalenae]|nr:hypothetical protein NFI96_010415 [Prochilodus magdalenae]